MARHAALETFGRSGNPIFGDKFNQSQGFVGSERMTLMEQLIKQVSLFRVCFIGAIISWNIPNLFLMYLSSALIGFGLAIYTSFVPRNAGITGPIYAFLRVYFWEVFHWCLKCNIQALRSKLFGLTFLLASLLFFYKSGLIKPTENYRLMIFSATFGIACSILLALIMSLFGSGIGFIHSNGIFGIGFSHYS